MYQYIYDYQGFMSSVRSRSSFGTTALHCGRNAAITSIFVIAVLRLIQTERHDDGFHYIPFQKLGATFSRPENCTRSLKIPVEQANLQSIQQSKKSKILHTVKSTYYLNDSICLNLHIHRVQVNRTAALMDCIPTKVGQKSNIEIVNKHLNIPR